LYGLLHAIRADRGTGTGDGQEAENGALGTAILTEVILW
jgi:hypothetical protein